MTPTGVAAVVFWVIRSLTPWSKTTAGSRNLTRATDLALKVRGELADQPKFPIPQPPSSSLPPPNQSHPSTITSNPPYPIFLQSNGIFSPGAIISPIRGSFITFLFTASRCFFDL